MDDGVKIGLKFWLRVYGTIAVCVCDLMMVWRWLVPIVWCPFTCLVPFWFLPIGTTVWAADRWITMPTRWVVFECHVLSCASIAQPDWSNYGWVRRFISISLGFAWILHHAFVVVVVGVLLMAVWSVKLDQVCRGRLTKGPPDAGPPITHFKVTKHGFMMHMQQQSLWLIILLVTIYWRLLNLVPHPHLHSNWHSPIDPVLDAMMIVFVLRLTVTSITASTIGWFVLWVHKR